MVRTLADALSAAVRKAVALRYVPNKRLKAETVFSAVKAEFAAGGSRAGQVPWPAHAPMPDPPDVGAHSQGKADRLYVEALKEHHASPAHAAHRAHHEFRGMVMTRIKSAKRSARRSHDDSEDTHTASTGTTSFEQSEKIVAELKQVAGRHQREVTAPDAPCVVETPGGVFTSAATSPSHMQQRDATAPSRRAQN